MDAARSTVTIEINNDSVPDGTWAPLISFVGNGKKAIPCAARWMRTTISNYRGGTNPTVNFGSTDDPCTFVEPAVPAADGVGAATNITSLPEFKTVTIGDPFTGMVILEYSEDTAGVDWAELPAMAAPGQMSFPLIAKWIRVRRQGIPTAGTPGTPIVNLGGVSPSSGGGIDTIGVNVEDEGVPVLTPAQTLNFTGMVVVTDGGSDTADIAVGAWDVTQVFTPGDSPVSAAINQLVQVDGSGGAVVVNLPEISAANKGMMIAIKEVSGSTDYGPVTVTAFAGDTLDNAGVAATTLAMTSLVKSVVLVSDGTSNWDVIADYGLPRVNTYSGDGAAPIDLDPADDTSWVVSPAAETQQTFNLPDGTIPGQIHNISALSAQNLSSLVVEVANMDPGETGTTFTLAATTPGALILVWQGAFWSLLSTRGFVNS